MAVRRAHHGDLDLLVAQAGHASCPLAPYHRSAFELEAEFTEELDRRREVLDDDADVVDPESHSSGYRAGLSPPPGASVGGATGNTVRVDSGSASAIRAWRQLAGAPPTGQLQVVVNPDSWLAPRGWIGIVAIGDAITASVDRADLKPVVEAALEGLSPDEATTPEVIVPRLPSAQATLGPAFLFYPPADFRAVTGEADEASADQIADLLTSASPEELDESGISHIESTAFVSRADDGTVASACGYRRWPNGVAHLSVLTHPDHRGQGHGRRAAQAAISAAIADTLLPQWRARPEASQRLAVAVGLARIGAQLSVHPT